MTRTCARWLAFLVALGAAGAARAQQAPPAAADKAAPPAAAPANQASPQPAAAREPPPKSEQKAQAHNPVRVRATMTVIDPRAGVDEIIGRLRKSEPASERKEAVRPAPGAGESRGARGAAGPERADGARQDQRDARAAARDAQRVTRDARRDNRVSSPERSGAGPGQGNGSGPH